MKRISVAAPLLTGNEKKYVMDAVESTWISSSGKYISQFEEMFAAFCNVKYAISTNNGTTALHLALVALGVTDGDEVLVPTVPILRRQTLSVIAMQLLSLSILCPEP